MAEGGPDVQLMRYTTLGFNYTTLHYYTRLHCATAYNYSLQLQLEQHYN